ncbi:MAG: IPT/TIG domain-containing protein [Actinomycetota bacterium]|nr:IPT/TIG domain-containing protein [Actinomycetota bacterium]
MSFDEGETGWTFTEQARYETHEVHSPSRRSVMTPMGGYGQQTGSVEQEVSCHLPAGTTARVSAYVKMPKAGSTSNKIFDLRAGGLDETGTTDTFYSGAWVEGARLGPYSDWTLVEWDLFLVNPNLETHSMYISFCTGDGPKAFPDFRPVYIDDVKVAFFTPKVNFPVGSEYYWEVAKGTSSPGPNNWDQKNVWQDSDGYLHLRISKDGSKYYCAGVYSTQKFGHGTYDWQVKGPVDKLDPNVVFGMFGYLNGTTPYTNEIDIEFARWGNPKWDNGNYTVWPANLISNYSSVCHTYEADLKGADESTHRYTWGPNEHYKENVTFRSFKGFKPIEYESMYLQHWGVGTNGNHIPSQPLNIHMNLWLHDGNAPYYPSNRHNVVEEIVIKNFQFIPASSVTSVQPTFGPPGTKVTVEGSGFGKSRSGSCNSGGGFESYVSFNGVPATRYDLWTDSRIVTYVPEGATPGPVAVVTLGGDSGTRKLFQAYPTWYLPEGCTDGGFETFALVQNPGNDPVHVKVSFQTGKGEVAPPELKNFKINPKSRCTFNVGQFVTDANVSTKVESTDGNVICERASYWNGRSGGTDSLGFSY